MNPDVELIARSIARDERAFGDLFDRHSTAVYRFAYSLTHDDTEAQELVQETFVTAWKKLADIRLAGDSMLPWLIVTTRNHALNLRRNRPAARGHADRRAHPPRRRAANADRRERTATSSSGCSRRSAS